MLYDYYSNVIFSQFHPWINIIKETPKDDNDIGNIESSEG